jgi:hypothetical protein
MAETKQPTSKSGARRTSGAWSEEERAAMREGASERKKTGRLTPEEERAQGEADIQAKIAEMPERDRALAERIHALVTATAPDLVPRTYYGMPAYSRDGKVVCFFKPASKFKERYATLGFEQKANLDDGSMWPVSFALTELITSDEERIAGLVRKAAS